MIHSESKKTQCLLDTLDSPKTVVRTSPFTIQAGSLQFTEKLYSWRLSAVSHLRFRSSTVIRRPIGSEPKITSTMDSSVSSSSSVASDTVATRAVFTIPVDAVPSVSNCIRKDMSSVFSPKSFCLATQ